MNGERTKRRRWCLFPFWRLVYFSLPSRPPVMSLLNFRSSLSTGSEVQICVDVAKALGSSGTRTRVVSMPCWELFENQGEAYQLEGEQTTPGRPTEEVTYLI